MAIRHFVLAIIHGMMLSTVVIIQCLTYMNYQGVYALLELTETISWRIYHSVEDYIRLNRPHSYHEIPWKYRMAEDLTIAVWDACMSLLLLIIKCHEQHGDPTIVQLPSTAIHIRSVGHTRGGPRPDFNPN